MPERLDIEGKVQTEKRKRGIFGAVVYTADLNMSVSYSIPEISGDQPSEIIWSKAYFSMGISDKRGLRGDIPFKSGSSDLEVLPGIREKHLFNSGITVPVTLSGEEEVLSCRLHILLSGSDELNFSPVGKTTRVSLQSSWADPGFRGNFLPSERVVNDKGFSAGWLITDLNRNFPQVWTGDKFDIAVDAFGVSFILLVDHYQKSLRSAKYGILFIALTFLALLFTELKSRVKFNIFHYLLFSLAVLLFFSLLNALSEQVGFNMAYLLSASLTIILVSAFLRALVMNTSQVLLFSGLLLFLYSFIYILLNLNDYAYLAGNIGLFILLSITMWISVRLRLFDTSC
jgi:inner membrane protein